MAILLTDYIKTDSGHLVCCKCQQVIPDSLILEAGADHLPDNGSEIICPDCRDSVFGEVIELYGVNGTWNTK